MTLTLRAAILTACLGFSGAAGAQQANPLDVIPDKMPFNIPYGAPISLARAQAAIAAATAEAEKRGWALNVAVVDSGANLVAFGAHGRRAARLDRHLRAQGADGGQISPSDQSLRRGNSERTIINMSLTLDDIIASRGGIPLVEDGKLIGAIGCSGGAGSQDEAACMVGAATINK